MDLGTVKQFCNPNSWEAEAGGLLQAWEQPDLLSSGQPGLQNRTRFQDLHTRRRCLCKTEATQQFSLDQERPREIPPLPEEL